METRTIYKAEFDAEAPKRVDKIVIEWEQDPDGDTSWLGEYTNTAPDSGFYVDRERRELIDARTEEVLVEEIKTNFGRGEYKYISGFQHSSDWGHVDDKNVTDGYLRCRYKFNGKADYWKHQNLFKFYGVKGWETAQTRDEKIKVLNAVCCCDDVARLEALQNGDWCFMGCTVKAKVSYPTGNGSRRLEELSSGGLWGIESDSDESYIKEVEQEQIEELKNHLEQFEVEWPELEPVPA